MFAVPLSLTLSAKHLARSSVHLAVLTTITKSHLTSVHTFSATASHKDKWRTCKLYTKRPQTRELNQQSSHYLKSSVANSNFQLFKAKFHIESHELCKSMFQSGLERLISTWLTSWLISTAKQLQRKIECEDCIALLVSYIIDYFVLY